MRNILRPLPHRGALVEGRPARGRFVARLEDLEGRTLLTAAVVAGQSPFLAIVPIETIAHEANPAGLGQPYGSSPAQIRGAYSLDSIRFASGLKGDGTGQTIAIVDAYDQPNIKADLHTFDQQFGLPDPPSFKVVGQDGSSNLPAKAGAGGWGLEISLDVEWAHALAPGASILLVEANSSGMDLFNAVAFAASQPGVSVVSMSWGSPEYSGETALDSMFVTPAGHPGVTFLAATGDSGAPGEYPAASPNVMAVGGTQFTGALNAQGTYPGETAWGDGVPGGSGGGGGVSPYEPMPSYQRGVVALSSTSRTMPDVSFDANTGVSVYDSSDYPYNPWTDVGGTSLATPCWGALIAIANQGAAAMGRGPLGGQAAMAALYSLSAQYGSTSFHDIVTGNNGFPATPGYDLATGIGTPLAPAIVEGLSGNVAAPAPSGPSGAVYNTAPTFQWAAVTGAQSYELVAYDQLTSAKALDVTVTGASYTPPSGTFAPGHAYWWTVTARAGTWTTGSASAALGFNLPVGSLPVNAGPADGGVTTTTPTLQWSAVPGAASYGVTIYDQANPSAPIYKQIPTGGTSLTFAFPLAAGHVYTWTVQAYFGTGGVGYYAPPSKATAFAVGPLAAAGLIAPASGSSTMDAAPSFRWSAVPGAVSYTLVVTDLTAGLAAITAAGLTGTSYAPPAALTVGHSYQWSVRAIDASGNPGVAPTAAGFAIIAPPLVVNPPAPSSPRGTVSTAQPSLTWAAVAGASGYGVEITDLTPGAQTSAFPLAKVGGTSYTPPSPLQAGHTYTWQVLAYSASGAASVWSTSLTFTVKDQAASDFDGVGRSEIAVATPSGGFLTIVNPVTQTARYVIYAAPHSGTIPAPGDFDGVGRTEIATYTASTGTWTVTNPTTGATRSFVFGGPGTVPIPGDYDGIGRTEPAYYTIGTATWTILNPITNTTRSFSWGVPNYWDVPTPGDFDGVGRTEFAAFVPSSATWYVWNPISNVVRTVNFGSTGNIDVAAPGDYDGIGMTEMAVYTPAQSLWTIWNPLTNTVRRMTAGAPGLHDVPLTTPSATWAALGLVNPGSSAPASGSSPGVSLVVLDTPAPVPASPALPSPTPSPVSLPRWTPKVIAQAAARPAPLLPV